MLFPNEVYRGAGYQKIYGRYFSMVVGSTVCKYGITTAETCGTIESTSATHVHNGLTGYYVRVKRNTFGWMNDYGDSGGPVYSNSSAYGLVHAKYESGTYAYQMLFMPIDRIADLGLTLIVQ